MLHSGELAFGGITGEITPCKVELRRKQIADGMFLHTCFDYGSSLTIIREALDAGGSAKIVSKIYFNYPDRNSCRYMTIWEQIVRFRDALGYQPEEWIVQISSMVPHQQISNQFSELVERAKAEYNISKFLFETYPRWESNSNRILERLEDLGLNEICGFVYYDNIRLIGATESFLAQVQSGGMSYATLRVLGINENIRNSLCAKGIDPLEVEQLVCQNIEKVINHAESKNFLFGVTATGNMSHYLDLIGRLDAARKLSSGDSKIEVVNSKFAVLAEDPYGCRRPFSQRIREPRQALKRFAGKHLRRSRCGWL